MRTRTKWVAGLGAVLVVAWWVLAGRVELPPRPAAPETEAAAAGANDTTTSDTALSRAIAPLAAAHPGRSGVHLLAQGRDAFATRVLLAEAAERTLDVQYYIWRGDLSGRLLLDALWRAADRGVRVRLLLDDNGTGGLDELLAALDGHPRIDVRLFNPFVQRGFKPLGMLGDFARLNRRMHNKSFTADGQASVVGGRNVGDAYFGAEVETVFVDLDVLAAGPIAQAVTADFERYWRSPSAYPIATLLGTDAAVPEPPESDLENPQARAYLQAVADSAVVRDLLARRLPLEWAEMTLLSDDPSKVLGQARKEDLMWPRIAQLLADAEREVHLVSPYFVPTERGTEALGALVGRGVRTTVLTNALEATDVAAVHAGYARWREPLLRAGVTLYELRRASEREGEDKGSGGGADTALHVSPLAGSSIAGSSGQSLHAKTFSVDRRLLFVGSFNFDPRSAALNTELGFVIDSPALAGTLAARLEQSAPQRAYRVTLADDGSLRWTAGGADRGGGTPPPTWDAEPGTSAWQRIAVRVLSWLPIESLL